MLSIVLDRSVSLYATGSLTMLRFIFVHKIYMPMFSFLYGMSTQYYCNMVR